MLVNDYTKIPELTLVMVERSQRMFGFFKVFEIMMFYLNNYLHKFNKYSKIISENKIPALKCNGFYLCFHLLKM